MAHTIAASLFLFLTMIFNSVNGQDLNGKWILKDIVSDNGKKSYPGFQLLEIKDSIAKFYTDFSLEKKASNLKVLEGEILTSENGKFGTCKVFNDNHLKLFVNGKANGEEAVFEHDFYRLLPTITTLKIAEIEKMTFIWDEGDNIKHELKFNQELTSVETLKMMNKNEGQKLLIEQIDATLFIANYHAGKRDVSFQIREVTTAFMKLYAIPTGPMEVIAYRKK